MVRNSEQYRAKGQQPRNGSLVGHARGRASVAIRADLPGVNSLQRVVSLDGITQVHKGSAYSVELINEIKNYFDAFSVDSHTLFEISNETGSGQIGT